ncbi:MAG: HlyC/CorC family transporter [Planctomycetaceae bacterium]|nr:HlyC/CorC family transporter [Planctomycetaceae bacterium]
MTQGSLIWIAIGSSVAAFFTATATKVLSELSWHELEEYCRIRKQAERFDKIHHDADSVALTTETLQIIFSIIAILISSSLFFSSENLTANHPLTTLGVTALLCFGFLTILLWIPREIARWWAPPFLVRSWLIWKMADRVLRPLHLVSWGVRLLLRRLNGRSSEPSDEEALEDEILSIVTEGQHDGLLEADVREMIAGVIELDDADVADIMTPRSKMDAIPANTNWEQMLQFVVTMGRTRIPVYGDNLDDIVGVLYVKDLLAELSKNEPHANRNLRSVLREAWQVPRSTRLDELLQKFLHTRSHLAIVVDEFTHVVGLVTIEDVLEEIVGEIVDESDKEELGEIRSISETVAEINARAHLEDINEQLGTELPEDQDYDTLGGFVLSELERIPKAGESLDWKNLQLTILDANKRRVECVRLEILQNKKTAGAN